MPIAYRDPTELNDDQKALIFKARKGLKDDVVTRTNLREFTKKHFDLEWPPAYIVKNEAFKVEVNGKTDRGKYNLAAVEGKAKANAALREYIRKNGLKAPRKGPGRATSHGKRGSRAKAS